MKAIIYCRKSTESEERQALSIPAQMEWAKTFAEQNNLEVVEVIQESKSAKKPGRAGFNKMLEMVASGKAEAIVCWQINRLARNPIDEGSIKWMLQSSTIKNIFSTDGVFGPSDILIMSVHFGMSTQYIIDLKKNVERGMKKKVQDGGICGRAPFGYKNDRNTRTAIVDEKDSEAVKLTFKLRIEGKGYQEISNILFARGYKRPNGKPIAKTTIERIIKNNLKGVIFFILYIF